MGISSYHTLLNTPSFTYDSILLTKLWQVLENTNIIIELKKITIAYREHCLMNTSSFTGNEAVFDHHYDDSTYILMNMK